jgi:hypothetical protein
MRVVGVTRSIAFLVVALAFAGPLSAQQDPFRWMDFHSQKDQDIVTWVTRSLDPEKWTAIREIGVQYDAALVVTTLRPTPNSPANADPVTIWSVSLTSHLISPILKGVNLRWLDWMYFTAGSAPEPTALYDSCSACAADTYFTAFHYDRSQHMWVARWMRGGQAAPIWSGTVPPGVNWTQVYAVMIDGNGRGVLATWNHFDYGKQKPPEDFLYRYDVDPVSGLERTLILAGKDADAMKQRLCRAQDAIPGLARGQDSTLCLNTLQPHVERKPVTTPPANNHGQSSPGGRR